MDSPSLCLISRGSLFLSLSLSLSLFSIAKVAQQPHILAVASEAFFEPSPKVAGSDHRIGALLHHTRMQKGKENEGVAFAST